MPCAFVACDAFVTNTNATSLAFARLDLLVWRPTDWRTVEIDDEHVATRESPQYAE